MRICCRKSIARQVEGISRRSRCSFAAFSSFSPHSPRISSRGEKKKKKKKKRNKQKMRLGPKPRQSYERSESVTWRYQRRKDNSDLIRVLGFALDCPRGGQLAVRLVVMVVGRCPPRKASYYGVALYLVSYDNGLGESSKEFCQAGSLFVLISVVSIFSPTPHPCKWAYNTNLLTSSL